MREDLDAFAREDLLGDGPTGYAAHRLAPAGPPGAAPVAVLTVLVEKVDLGVAGTDQILYLAVLVDVNVLRIDVSDQQAHRGAGGQALEKPADDLDAVGLLARRVDVALARATLLHLVLNLRNVQLDPGRDPVDNGKQGSAVAAVLSRGVPAV